MFKITSKMNKSWTNHWNIWTIYMRKLTKIDKFTPFILNSNALVYLSLRNELGWLIETLDEVRKISIFLLLSCLLMFTLLVHNPLPVGINKGYAFKMHERQVTDFQSTKRHFLHFSLKFSYSFFRMLDFESIFEASTFSQRLLLPIVWATR